MSMDVDEGNMSASSSVPSKDPTPALPPIPKSPVVIIMIGMAGSGKSTWTHRLIMHLLSEKKRVYSINLDPAVKNVLYPVNIDIRDTVNYKEVMKHFELGPNGAIMTSLNLFATRFDQVLTLLERRAPDLDYIVVDTPGQIEVFNWSASGQIICDALSVSYPTVVCYTVDTARCTKPVTFMSNMLYACSILYKTKLPFVVCFNKVDVLPYDFLKEWMEDYQAYGEALQKETSYVSSLSRSMSLAMEEFYSKLRHVGVSAISGEGCQSFMEKLQDAAQEFQDAYVPFLEAQRQAIKEKRERIIEEQLRTFEAGLDRQKRGREPDDEEIEGVSNDLMDFSIDER